MYKDLSLKEKSELFKLMVSNGITDINEIERIYNKYWDGGSVETPQQRVFNKSTIDDRPTTTNSELQWFNNWYTNRTHLINIKDVQNHINQIYKTPEKSINIIDPYTKAFYVPKNKTIYYDKNVKSEDKIHERTHAGEFKRQERLIKNFAISPKYILEQNDYLDSPNEVYARLNEVRFKNKLNPLQIYTLNDIKYLKQHGYDNEILNRYDDDTLLFLFNEIAQNNNDKSNNNIEPNLTAFGGKINKFDEGGPTKNIDKNNTFWEKADQFVSDAEYALTIPGLALSGITLALPNPATFIADKVVDGASMLLDGYQVGRAIYNKDWDSLATNSLEFVLAAAGAKDIKNSVQGMLQSKRAYQNAITYNDKINAEHLYNLYKKKTTKGIFKEATSHAIPFIVGTINKTPEILDTKEKSDKTSITPKPIVYPYLPVEVTDTLQKTNKYDEGGNVVLPNVVVSPRNSYYTYTGKETITPTWQEFAKAKQNEARDDAYLGMLSQGKPIVPEIPNQNTFAKLINVGMTTFGANDQDVIKVVGKEGPENVFTCINTVTGQYDDCNQVSGNITFSKSPSKYGFKEVNTPRIGDLVQFTDNTGTPHHAAMVTGFDENGEPIISYSDGGWESESMKYDKDTWKKDFEGDTWKYYTFIGNRKNASKWREEYDKKFKNKVK